MESDKRTYRIRCFALGRGLCQHAAQMRLVLLAAFVALAQGCATTQQQPAVWEAAALAKYSAPQVRLVSRDQSRLIGVISVQQVRVLVDVAEKISRQAGAQPSIGAYLMDAAEPNAFAGISPQGLRYIVLTVPMFELLGTDQDAMAALVGHEVAHLALEHGKERAARENVRAGASQAIGLVLSAAGVPLGGTVASVAATAIERTYTREEERHADRIGLIYAKQAGYDPRGAVRLWEKMGARGQAGLLPFLSSHPQDSERLETMRQLAQ